MRRHSHNSSDLPPASPSKLDPASRTDWQTLSRLFPYLWRYKWRVSFALAFMLSAKLANVGVPLLLKKLVDAMTPTPAQSLIVIPVALLLAYGALRLATSLFTELRELIFAKATEGTSRAISLQVFEHLHNLSLRFHLERQTGGMTRDIERGTRGIHSLISFSLYSIVPTLIEVLLVLTFLAVKFDAWFAVITGVALVLYIFYTVSITEWRTQFRKEMNALDSTAHSRAVDSLLNYETVKYFNNEAFETKRYNDSLERYRRAAVKSQTTLSLLNTGQQIIIATALVVMLWRATEGVAQGRMTLGDLVMVNAFMIQLYIPLNFLGVMYREIKQSLTDLEKMFSLLEREREVADLPDAKPLELATQATRARELGSEPALLESDPKFLPAPDVAFKHVTFAYEPSRTILHDISFAIPAGKTVAVVGSSGSGKSTLARLLYRFYDVQGGSITVNGADIRSYTQSSLRRAIGIVPQDTVLFNDSVAYNIGYGDTAATQAQIEAAAKAAHIHDFIASTPLGYGTAVGERGLKLSGGEKQRVAIARTLLKNPHILIFDEATSALDSSNERAIQLEIQNISQNKTTLVIAHRLSTVINAHEILVMDSGRIIERGSHADLLAMDGRYSQMWNLQSSEQHKPAQNPELELAS